MASFSRQVNPTDWWRTVQALRDELATAGNQSAASRLNSALTMGVTTSTELYYECLNALDEILRLIPESEIDRRMRIQQMLDNGRSFFDAHSINYLFRR